MLQLFWYCLDLSESDKQKIVHYFNELTKLLQKHPTYIKLIAEPMPTEAAQEIKQRLCTPHKDFQGYIDDLGDYCLWEEHYFSPLLILCKRKSKIAVALRDADPSGRLRWGGTLNCDWLVLVWNLNNKYAVWHEALHLIGTKDCYTPDNPRPTCELPNCIMQYIPTKESVGEWPFLCHNNVERIRDWSRKYSSGED